MSIVVSNSTRNILTKIGNKINSPEQRLLQGVVALAIQPLIDYNNKTVDDDTRRVATARTIGKVIAGTTVGVAVRYLCIKAVELLSKTYKYNPDQIVEFIRTNSKINIFTPTAGVLAPNLTGGQFEELYKNYVKSMGTFIATITMMVTNFAIDAPMTKAITKFMEPKVQKRIDKDKKEALNVSK